MPRLVPAFALSSSLQRRSQFNPRKFEVGRVSGVRFYSSAPGEQPEEVEVTSCSQPIARWADKTSQGRNYFRLVAGGLLLAYLRCRVPKSFTTTQPCTDSQASFVGFNALGKQRAVRARRLRFYDDL